ncbi:ABC transporter permease subunit [Streptomyces sioyaensis]|uniref:ABC transporter permease subunit n=1 Tax=Streptomyces sioyaensis TaxID=67364 RepID=UPI001F38A7E7|nr:ABC transporter permease subunit [Streptomyces sioyaensis]MCF3176499.1 ABC transporter permease subunit [Streptomyces sioyaensis]
MTRTSTAGARAADTTDPGSVPAGPAARRTLLHGLPWLVWRRHRTALRLLLLTTAVGCAVFAYQRAGLTDFLHTHGAGPALGGALGTDFQNAYGGLFRSGTQLMTYLPVLIGVFLGAPLIAAEQEHGTVKLISTQSVSRGRWVAATLGLPLAVAALCTALLSAVFTWLWTPARLLVMDGDWLTSGIFESTGPVPVARTLFLTVCGIALGMLLKRAVPAMAGTLVLTLVTSVLWSEKLRGRLGTLRSVSYPYDGNGPALPPGAVRMDDWVSTADGRLYGFGTCTTGDTAACRAKLGIVNRVTQYIDYGQMAGMQWLGAGILLALTVLVLACVVWRAHRRPL